MEDVLLGVLIVVLVIASSVIFILHSERDAVSGLIAYSVVLFLVPARYVFPGTGAVGTPAIALGLALALWWLVSKALPQPVIAYGPQPIRTVVLLYTAWTLISYAFSMRRALSVIEQPGADRAAIAAIALAGVALVAADGIRDRKRLDTLVSWLVGLAAIVALFAVVQFFTSFDPVRYIRVPGLDLTRDLGTVVQRGDLSRPFSTTLHPIELGVLMAMLLPLALYRLTRPLVGIGQAAWRWACVVLIASVVFLSVSRSAVVAAVVSVAVYSIALSRRSRLNLLGLAVLAVFAARLLVPGLVGTLVGLFAGFGEDSSVQARLTDVSPVLDQLSVHPVLGFGPGTLNIVEDLLLDNEYYTTALSSGLPGLVLLMTLVCTGIVTARRAARGADPETRRLGYALIGSITAAGVALATFDGFSFRMFTGVFFLLLGMAGALWRIQFAGPLRRPSTRPSPGRPVSQPSNDQVDPLPPIWAVGPNELKDRVA